MPLSGTHAADNDVYNKLDNDNTMVENDNE